MQKKYADSKITILLLGLDSLEKDRENRKKLFREHHIGCGGDNFTKICHYYYSCHYCHYYCYYYWHNLSFWVLSQLNFFEFCHNFYFFLLLILLLASWVFLVLTQFLFVKFWVFFCQFEFFSFVKIWFFFSLAIFKL